MKYRLVRRAQGWVIQRKKNAPIVPVNTVAAFPADGYWHFHACWRFCFVAALHLFWLRERARVGR